MLSVSRLCSVGYCRVTKDWWIGRDLDGTGRGLIEAICQHLTGGAEENYKINLRIAGVQVEIRTESHLTTRDTARLTCLVTPCNYRQIFIRKWIWITSCIKEIKWTREATPYTARVKQRKHRTNYNDPFIQRKTVNSGKSKYNASKLTAPLTRGARILYIKMKTFKLILNGYRYFKYKMVGQKLWQKCKYSVIELA
jgi:hypothetical protein